MSSQIHPQLESHRLASPSSFPRMMKSSLSAHASPVCATLIDRLTPSTSFAHNCKDTTAATAESAGAQALVLHDDGSRGKGAALHHGFTHALAQHHTAILVVDADSVVDPTLTGRVTRAFADGADAVQARYIASTPVAGTRTAIMALSLTGMNFVRPRGRSRLGLSSGIFGNGFALSAATICAVPYTARSVVEDLEYHLSLVASGRSVRFLEYAIVRGELPDNDKAAGTQRARWEGGRARIRRDFVPGYSGQSSRQPAPA